MTILRRETELPFLIYWFPFLYFLFPSPYAVTASSPSSFFLPLFPTSLTWLPRTWTSRTVSWCQTNHLSLFPDFHSCIPYFLSSVPRQPPLRPLFLSPTHLSFTNGYLMVGDVSGVLRDWLVTVGRVNLRLGNGSSRPPCPGPTPVRLGTGREHSHQVAAGGWGWGVLEAISEARCLFRVYSPRLISLPACHAHLFRPFK